MTSHTTKQHPPPPAAASSSSIQNPDILAVRAFVTASDGHQYDNVHCSQVVVDLTHSNLQQRHAEIRLYKHDTVATLQQLIHQKTGTPPHYQQLQIYDITGECIGTIENDSNNNNNKWSTYKLGYFGIVQHGMRIHCVDTNPYSISANGALENTALVEKFSLTEEEYNAKQKNTLRAWARQQKEQDPTFTYSKHAAQHKALVEATRQYKAGLPVPSGFHVNEDGIVVATSGKGKEEEEEEDYFGPESVQHIEINARCQIHPGGRRGRVAWKGEIQFPTKTKMPGYWVGIVLDEPTGKNSGTLDGITYFETPGDKYGSFVRGKNVETGDFPELDLLDELDSSSEEDEL